jgi:hypothetical protein
MAVISQLGDVLDTGVIFPTFGGNDSSSRDRWKKHFVFVTPILGK